MRKNTKLKKTRSADQTFNLIYDIAFGIYMYGGISVILVLLFKPYEPVGKLFFVSILPFIIGLILLPVITVLAINRESKKMDQAK